MFLLDLERYDCEPDKLQGDVGRLSFHPRPLCHEAEG